MSHRTGQEVKTYSLVPDYAFQDEDLTKTHLFLLGKATMWPGEFSPTTQVIHTLAEIRGVSPTTLRRALNDLREMGYLQEEPSNH